MLQCGPPNQPFAAIAKSRRKRTYSLRDKAAVFCFDRQARYRETRAWCLIVRLGFRRLESVWIVGLICELNVEEEMGHFGTLKAA